MIRGFGQFLDCKRDAMELMDTPSPYLMLLNSLTEEDIELMQNSNVRFGMIIAPASQISLPTENLNINLICFEKHCLNLFNKSEIVAIILHEIGHVFNPNRTGDEHEFLADDFAVKRGYRSSIISSLQRGMKLDLPGFNQAINQRRIARLNDVKLYS